jgi:hypothetical protein
MTRHRINFCSAVASSASNGGRILTLKIKAARTRFVTTRNRTLASKALDELQNRRTLRTQWVKRRRPVIRQQHGRDRRGPVLINPDAFCHPPARSPPGRP